MKEEKKKSYNIPSFGQYTNLFLPNLSTLYENKDNEEKRKFL